MDQMTVIPSETLSYEELEARTIRLEGKLAESRCSQHEAERFAVMCLALFAVSTTLLALTWGGVIMI